MKPIDQLTDEELMAEFSSLAGGQSQSAQPTQQAQDNWVASSMTRSGPTMTNISASVAEKQAVKGAEMGMEGVGSDLSGKVVLAREAVKKIDDVINTLFPKGTKESFDWPVAATSNLPYVQSPGWLFKDATTPQVIPNLPGKWDNKLGEKAQRVNREIGTSLSGRQLIQTGVAARPDETQKLVAAFAPNAFSNPGSALDGLKQLREFYLDFLRTVDPQGVKGANPIVDSSEKLKSLGLDPERYELVSQQ